MDNLENKILDGQSFEEASKENNLKINVIRNIDGNKKNKNNKIVEKLSDKLFKKIYSIKKEKAPEVLKVNNKYFLAEINSIKKEIRLRSILILLKILVWVDSMRLNSMNLLKIITYN